MEDRSRSSRRLRRLAAILALGIATLTAATLLLSRADGPIFVFAGGPLRSGEQVGLADLDWIELDRLHALELEIVGAGTSRTLWFSVYEGVPYVGCDLDCLGGLLSRWPQQIELDDRVVIRIDKKRAEGRLVHVPHGSAEYRFARAERLQKYSGDEGAFDATETAAHNAVIDMGNAMTGRSKRTDPGDRLYRVEVR